MHWGLPKVFQFTLDPSFFLFEPLFTTRNILKPQKRPQTEPQTAEFSRNLVEPRPSRNPSGDKPPFRKLPHIREDNKLHENYMRINCFDEP